MRSMCGVGLAVVCALSAAACSRTNILTPPVRPAAPVPVAVLDHGQHSSLVVGLPTGEMVRYAYGDWRWYAEDDTGIVQGAAALFSETPAALGRRLLPGPLTPANLRRQVKAGFQDAVLVEVEADKARALVNRLDAIAAAGRDGAITNPRADLVFYPHPQPYSMASGSNRAVSLWLEEMGVGVEGDAFIADWRIGGPAAE